MAGKKRYSAEFRVQAVRLLTERVATGSSIKRVGEELGVQSDLLWSWAREVEQAPAGALPEEIFPGHGRKRSYTRRNQEPAEEVGPETPEQELSRLRRENDLLRRERDFLKKAAAFFAKESQ